MVIVVGVGSAREGVSTRLGDGVDATAREATLTHIEGSGHHLNIADGIERNGVSTRQTAIRTRRGEAIHIVRGRAVNLEGVVARICSRNGDSAILRHHSLRREACDIVDGARHGGRALNQVAMKYRIARTHIASFFGYADHHRLDELVVDKRGVDVSALAQGECYIVDFLLVVAHKRELDGVGATHTQALQTILAIAVGDGAIDGLGGEVRCHYGSTYQRPALLVGDKTLQRCSGRLCGSCYCHYQSK